MTSRLPDLDALLAPADDDERREGDWLVARDADPAAPPPSEEARRRHDELAELLATLPAGKDDERWQDAVLAAAHAADTAAGAPARRAGDRPAPRRRWLRLATMAGALAAAAAAVVYVMSRPPDAPAAELQIAIHRVDAARSEDVAVGDRLVIRARPHGPTELRVYQDQEPVLRCPGLPGCADGAATWQVDLRLAAPVRHVVILAYGPVTVGSGASLDEFVAAARAAGARLVVHPPIDVH